MAGKATFDVTFLGVRGRIPCPGPKTARYGGNTRCLEMRLDDRRLIFDAGTGIRPLGDALAGAAPVSAQILLSYTGPECISGIPFFIPAYDAGNAFRLWAGRGTGGRALREVLAALMNDPMFPVPVDIFDACFAYEDFDPGETIAPARDLLIRTARVHDTAAITGFRVEAAGKSVCYLPDLAPPGSAPAARALVAGADIAILGAGEGTDGTADWRAALRFAADAGARVCVLARHEPDWDDDALDRIAAEAATLAPGAIVAREGLTLSA